MKQRLSLYEFVPSKGCEKACASVLEDVGKVRKQLLVISKGSKFYGYKDEGCIRMCYGSDDGEYAMRLYKPFLISCENAKLLHDTDYYLDSEAGDFYERIPYKVQRVQFGKVDSEPAKKDAEPIVYADYQSRPWYVGVFHWIKCELGYHAAELFKKEFLTEEPDEGE